LCYQHSYAPRHHGDADGEEEPEEPLGVVTEIAAIIFDALCCDEHTAAELIYERVDNEKPFVGMTNFKGNYVTRDDVKIAKNYLSELELQRLNLLTSQFLDYAEFQALEQNPMTMADWISALDDQILRLRKNILEGNGTVSHQEAIEKAEREFEIYREREMRQLESDFDKAVKRLKNKKDKDDKEET